MNRHNLSLIVYFIVLIASGIVILAIKEWDTSFILDAFLFAIITSIIGSIAFILLLWMLKPDIKIATQIAQTSKDDKNIYLFKFINESWFFALYNVEVHLFSVRNETVNGGYLSKFEPLDIKKSKITKIPRKLSDKN